LSPAHWPQTPEEAERVQREVVERVEIPTGPVPSPRTVAGLDVSYATDSDRINAAGVLVNVASGEVVEEATVEGVVAFPYVPGLLAFREVPILLRVLERFGGAPDLLLCDGQGLAHPRRCGVACHLGVLAGLPAIGCAKTWFVGEHDQPGQRRGARTPLVDEGQVVGEVLRTQDRVKPVYVSPGHAIGLAQASDIVLSLCSRYRLPDPLRRADRISRQALRRARMRGSPEGQPWQSS
jgi:deoxyribonuclease V